MKPLGKPNPSRPPDTSFMPNTELDSHCHGKILSPLDTIALSRMSIASQLSLDDEILSGLPMTPEMARVCFGHQNESLPSSANNGIYNPTAKRTLNRKSLSVDVTARNYFQENQLHTPVNSATTSIQSSNSLFEPVRPGTPDLTRRSRVSFRDKSRKDKAVVDSVTKKASNGDLHLDPPLTLSPEPKKSRPKPPPLQLKTTTPTVLDSSNTRPGLKSAVEFSSNARSIWFQKELPPAPSAPSAASGRAHRAQAQSWDSAAGRSNLLELCIVPEPLSRPRTPRTPLRSSYNYGGQSVDSPDWSRKSQLERKPPPFDPTSTRDHVAMGIFHVEAGNKDWVLHHWRYAALQRHPVGTLLYALALREGWGDTQSVEGDDAQELPQILHIDPLELLALAPPPCLRLARAFERLAKAYQLAKRPDEMLRAYQLAQIISKLN